MTPRWILLVMAMVGCALDVAPYPPPKSSVESWLHKVDWDGAGKETVETLQGYLRVDTSNPPGNETQGAQYLAALLKQDGIESEVLEFAPGRGALVARVTSEQATQDPLCLMHHVDVATAEPAQWPADKAPFSGVMDEKGELWGRGALDMKGLGALEVDTLRWLKRLGVPLNRDVILLAVPDEEVDNQGMKFLMEKHWERLRCSHVINEGGMGIKDMFIQGQTVFTISVAEKGVLWVRMTAHGESGHGSVYLPGRAPERLIHAVEKVLARKPAAVVHASYLELLSRVGEQQGGFTSLLLRRPLLTETALGMYALRQPMMRGAVSNTVQVTGLFGAKQPNVVPSEVSAQLDCRLLPGVTPGQMLEELRLIVDDPQVSFEVLHQAVGTGSSWDDPLFRALATHAVKGRTDAVAAPVMGPLYSDSVPLRTLGVKAYGFTPFEVTQDMLRSMHGKDERVSMDNIHRGLKILLGAVLEVSTP